MRVVASVQAKRGSSRGLVHYIAHSKLDAEREPQSSREIFNAFADELSVRSANNSMRVGIAKGRPSNDELHHLVLSFRDDDYRKLGEDETRRKRAMKEITRAAMKSLENAADAERLLWTAAIHRNTGNPHVHIAIQKQYLTKEIERRTLTKIPREALPHYETRDNEKVLINGHLIDAAAEKMDTIIGHERTREKVPRRFERKADSREHLGRATGSEATERLSILIAEERTALAKEILAEYELLRIETKIDSLLDNGSNLRFTISDPVTDGKKRRSLRDVQKQDARNDPGQPTPGERQIRKILHKMLAKEEAAKSNLQNDHSDVIREARRIRSAYRKSGRPLPLPSLSKNELDALQEQCLDRSDIRRFSYLERIRTELIRAGEVEPRSKDDLRLILASKNISELRSSLSKKMHREQSEKGYYRRFDIGDRSLSLADLDGDQKDRENPILLFFEKIKSAASRLSRSRKVTPTNQTDPLRVGIIDKLAERVATIGKAVKVDENKAKVLGSILSANTETDIAAAAYSPEQIAELEKLSIQLKTKSNYETSWTEQRSIIETAGFDSVAYQRLAKANPTVDFAEHKNQIIAGRALAREIVAKVGFDAAKEDLNTFREARRFQKFAIPNKHSGGVSYLSLHDVDLPRRGSLLDRTIRELSESREHRELRRTVSGLADDKERRLKDEAAAAKGIMVSASRTASAFKEFSYLGLRSETAYQPIFTTSEIAMLERRVSNTGNPREAERLRTHLESAADRSVRSLGDLLRDFETPKTSHSEVREVDMPKRDQTDDRRLESGPDRGVILSRSDRSVDGPSR